MPMRRLALVLLLLVLSAPLWAAAPPAFVKVVCSAAYQGGGTCTGTPTTAGDLLVVHLGDFYAAGNATSVMAGANSLTNAVGCAYDHNSFVRYQQWWGYAPTNTPTTFTPTWASGSDSSTMIVVEYSGASPSASIDSGANSHVCNASLDGGGTVNFGGVTTTTVGAQQTIVCGIASYGGDPFTAGTNFANLVNVNWAWIVAEDRPAANPGTYGTTLGTTAPTNMVGGCATYHETIVVPDYTISGPSSGYATAASSAFTVTKTKSGSISVTISDGGHSSIIASCAGTGAAPYTITTSAGTCTFTVTAPLVAALTLTSTSSGSDPVPNIYPYNSQGLQLSFSGCSSGNLRVASATCTVSIAHGTFDGTNTVTLASSRSVDTLTSGTPGNPVTVTPTNGSSSFTYTITPYLVGNSSVSATVSTTNWLVPTPFLYTSSSTDASTFTAKLDGNWNSSATWNCSGCASHNTPDSGDSVVITGYHVTCPTGVTCYAGTCPLNITTYGIQLTPSGGNSGWMEIQSGAKLWYCGNSQLKSPSGTTSTNPTSFGIFQVDDGGEFDLDNNHSDSVSYRITGLAAYGWNKLLIGTTGHTCTFSTGTCPTTIKAVNLGAANPVLFDTNSVADDIIYKIYGASVTDCGSASKACVEYYTAGSASSYPSAGIIDVEGSIFNRTGTFQAPVSGTTGPATPTFLNNRFLNDLAGVWNLNVASSVATSQTCAYQGNYLSGPFACHENHDYFNGCSFTGNTFASDFCFFPNGTPMAALADNAVVLVNHKDQASFANYVRNIWINTTPASSAHSVAAGAGTPFWMASENIWLVTGVQANSDPHCMLTGSALSGSNYLKIVNNLSLPLTGGDGTSSGQFLGYTPSGTGILSYIDHNGAFGTAPQDWGTFLGHNETYLASNQILQSYRANLHWAPSAGSRNLAVAYGFPDADPGLANAPSNTNTANLGWNGFYHTASGGAQAFVAGFDSHCILGSAYLGTPYSICEVAKASPDNTTHDITLTTPQATFIDLTRNPLTWAQRVHGQTATLAGMLTVFQTCQDETWCVEEARAWTARGFQPTNLVLKGKAHDGRIVGFTGTYGSGYTGSCTVTFTPQDAADLGTGAAATCSFAGGVPVIQITNPGANYRIATPATVTIGGTCTGGCVAASLAPGISPHDIGPVQMALMPGAM